MGKQGGEMKKGRAIRSTYVGIDVSKDLLDVDAEWSTGVTAAGQFENTGAGFRQLLSWMGKRSEVVYVVMEATGVYHLDLALFLHDQKKVKLMVVNPRAARDFARASMQQAKTDAVTARVLREFAKRMEFVPWQPPRKEVLQLRTISRRVEALTRDLTAEKNRLHAAEAAEVTPRAVRADIKANLKALAKRIEGLAEQALVLVRSDEQLQERYEILVSVKGITASSAIQIMAELLVLPSDMTARQWVAHAGLDPRPFESGSSVHRPTRISKVGNARLRGVLYMPALVAQQCDPNVGAFREKLLSRGGTRRRTSTLGQPSMIRASY
jgi:transposase